MDFFAFPNTQISDYGDDCLLHDEIDAENAGSIETTNVQRSDELPSKTTTKKINQSCMTDYYEQNDLEH